MRSSEEVSSFVRDALIAGRSREEIADALAEAGWAPNEVSDALNAWADTDFTPPVPRPRIYLSAREAFVYGLMFVALAMTAWHLTTLSYSLIDRWLPDLAERRPDIYLRQQMRWSIAALIVFLPLFVVLNERTHRALRADPGKRRSGVRRWLGYVTLFITALVLLGDAIYVIYAFLNGDMTLRFAAKAIVTAAVAGAIFLYFRTEMRKDADAR